MEEGSDYYVVRKGDLMAVYKTLSDCQAQICSSVCVSVMKLQMLWSFHCYVACTVAHHILLMRQGIVLVMASKKGKRTFQW